MQVFAASKTPARGRVLHQLTCFFLKNRQAVRIMKLTTILLLAACMQLSARGLTQTVSISVKDAPLLTVLKAIEKQTDFVFIVDNQWLQKTKKVTITANNLPLHKVLEMCFKDQPLTYNISGKVIVVTPKEEKSKIESPTPTTQTVDVRGKVLNENGEPVTSASVSVKGTSRGTTTNDNGEFYLPGIEENAILIISGVNINTTEVKVNGLSNLAINVKNSIAPLEETIIKGYYTTSRRLNTGSVSKVTSKIIQQQPVGDVLQALEGRIPGLIISQSSGVPGSFVNVRLRGQNSIANGNDPLYIVDGVPFTSTSLTTGIGGGGGVIASPFNVINANDIESVDVLKDADATAIYGSRGANGVILITTKKAVIGKTKFDFNIYAGYGNVPKKMDLLNTQQYLQMRIEAINNDNLGRFLLPQYARFFPDILSWDTTRYTDWQKKIIGNNANITNASISASGGNSNTKFLVSGNFRKESTVFPGDYYSKNGSAHFNLTNTSNDQKFNLGLSASYVVGNRDLPQSDLTSFALLPPDAPSIYDNDGNLNWQNNSWKNPFAELKKRDKDNSNNLIGSLAISYKLFTGLELKTNLSYNNYKLDETVITPLSSYAPNNTAPSLRTNNFANSSIKTWNIEPQLNYDKQLGQGHLNALIVTSFLETIQTSLAQSASGFSSDDLIENISAASSITVVSNNYSKYRYNALRARINYNFKEKYILNLTGNRDGSSRYGINSRFGNFGAIGTAWIFTKENLIRRKLPFLTYGKLRASYGTTGNDQIGDYVYISTYSSYPYQYQGLTGLIPTRLPNSSYGWEQIKKLETGLELGFLDDRFFLTLGYYRFRTGNQLVAYPLPSLTGGQSIIANLPAVIENKGWEIEWNSHNIKSQNFKWSTSFNISFPKNKLVSFPGIEKTSYANNLEVGKSLYIRKLLHFIGVNPQTGTYDFQDIDNDGQLSFPNDFIGLKKISQSYFGGISNNFVYKNFQLDFFIQYVKQTGYDYKKMFTLPGGVSGSSANQLTVVLNRWQKPGDATAIQKFTQSYAGVAGQAYSNTKNLSDGPIADASFIRLKNVSLSYQLPQNLKNKLHLQNVRIYLQGQNLLTKTNYLGLDPETQTVLPPLRIITAGLQLTF